MRAEKLSIILVVFAVCAGAFAEIKMPSIFSDGMVLQAQKGASVWGTARAGAKVDVEYLSGLSPDALAALRPLAKENAWAGVAANRIGDGYRDISAYEWSLTCRLLPETAFVAFPDCAHAEFVAGQPEAFAARLAETLERD